MAGPIGQQKPIAILASITADCTAGRDYTINRAGTVIDVRAVSNSANVGTVSVRNVADPVTVTALALAGDTLVARAADLDNDHYTFAAAGTMNFITTNAAAVCDVTVFFLPPVADAVVQV